VYAGTTSRDKGNPTSETQGMASTTDMTIAQANAEHMKRCRHVQVRSQLERFLSRLAYFKQLEKAGCKLTESDKTDVKNLRDGIKQFEEYLENI
jgi:hypothetical protein